MTVRLILASVGVLYTILGSDSIGFDLGRQQRRFGTSVLYGGSSRNDGGGAARWAVSRNFETARADVGDEVLSDEGGARKFKLRVLNSSRKLHI